MTLTAKHLQFMARLSIVFICIATPALAADPATEKPDAPATSAGVLPIGEDGKPLNTDFETGDLRDWTMTGNAFNSQPIKGDTINPRRRDANSRHAGDYWIGTYEIAQDGPRGILTSKPFKVTHPWAMFLVGGGANDESVDIVLKDSGKLFFHAAGDNVEDMQPIVVDMRPIMGQTVFLRVVDDHSFGWGHINFDDFKFYDAEPKVAKRVVLSPDAVKHAGLKPEEAVKEITLPEGFSATLFAGEPDVNQPVGFTIDDRGRLWVAEAWTYPIRAKDGQGKDRILIFEDTDGDGKHDKRTVFAEKLNLVSGIEVGFGGVFIGAAPYLMFIPDKNGDDKPDSDPQILLDGWAWQDTHETLNAFTWGPDGWLYGCHGVFTHSRVGKPGTPDKDRVPLNAAVWRYHPQKQTFEVFAEGTSNPWGIDFNDRGQAFITACVIPHLYHVIQGARYQRQAGQHFNPHVYRDIQNIGDHVHWLGDKGPHAGNEKSGSAGGGHAHCGAMIYLGDSWPAQYRNTLFMSNIHGNRLNNDKMVAKGSGYVGTHAPDPVLMNDKWSRLINFKYGPDGSVYMIDWYDKQACHNPLTEIWDRTNGRIYKLIYNNQPAVKVDLAKLSDDELVELQLHANEWYVRHARRLLQERGAKDVAPKLVAMLNQQKEPTKQLRALWALHAVGGLTKDVIEKQLNADDAHVRAWTIQLAAERMPAAQITRSPFDLHHASSDAALAYGSTFIEMAKSDDSPVVRLYLASAAQRLPTGLRWPLLWNLAQHEKDAADHNLPLMYWYAAEPIVAHSPKMAVDLARKSKIPLLRELIARRITAIAGSTPEGKPAGTSVLAGLVKLLAETNDKEIQLDILNGMTDGLAGRRSMPAPPNWSAVYDKLAAGGDDAVRIRVVSLSTVFGDERAFASMRKIMQDTSADGAERRRALDALVGAKDPALPPLLQKLLTDPAVGAAAVRGLAAYDDPKTPAAIIAAYPSLDQPVRLDALSTLASRADYAAALKQAVNDGTIAKEEITPAIMRQLTSLESDDIRDWVAQTLGTIRTTPADKVKEIERLKKVLRGSATANADPMHGRALFAKTCVQCHVLFGTGGKVGPDLTGSNRADADYLVTNIVDPGAVIGKDYLVSVIKLKDRRVLSGIVKADDGNAITLATESETLVIPKSDITLQKQQEGISMMPEGLVAAMNPSDFRDLAVYMRSVQQVPMLATPVNVKSFFNGKDLAGWDGDPALWSVENGEIVGRAPQGLKKNQFLFSHMAAGDFRLTFRVKLIDDTGNSGVQFRSEAFNGDAKGYQADIGPGWWGKLYEEHGRELLWPKSGEQYVKKNDWNTYEIVAVGNRILTAINGHPCVDLKDPEGATRGIFALQLHSGPPMEVRFRDFKLELNPKAELSTAAATAAGAQ
jgi:putative membrane-bound dehydrogenase-like protein